MKVVELDDRFDEVNIELLLCMACFDLSDLFSAFDRLAEFYSSDFSEIALYELESQLENFIIDVSSDVNFSDLSLILPVATSTVEKAFSAMKFIKSSLRNRIRDKLLNDCLVTYIEKYIFQSVSNEVVMQHFQSKAYSLCLVLNAIFYQKCLSHT
ncbi:hypothetical protein ACS0TY_027539 [Phlomoides rotata]